MRLHSKRRESTINVKQRENGEGNRWVKWLLSTSQAWFRRRESLKLKVNSEVKWMSPRRQRRRRRRRGEEKEKKLMLPSSLISQVKMIINSRVMKSDGEVGYIWFRLLSLSLSLGVIVDNSCHLWPKNRERERERWESKRKQGKNKRDKKRRRRRMNARGTGGWNEWDVSQLNVLEQLRKCILRPKISVELEERKREGEKERWEVTEMSIIVRWD